MNASTTKFAATAVAVVAGVFLAGTLMNAFRSNDLVKYAINGYDA